MSTDVFMRGRIDSSAAETMYLVAREGPVMYIAYGQGNDFAFASVDYTPAFPPRLFRGLIRSEAKTGDDTSTVTLILESLIEGGNLGRITSIGSEEVRYQLQSGPGTPISFTPQAGVEGLWAGVWYKAPGRWPIFGDGGEEAPFVGRTDDIGWSSSTFEIMFLPRRASRDEGIGVWVSGKGCVTSPDPDVTIRLFSGWARGDVILGPRNCSGRASSSANQCPFVSLGECRQQYFYDYCTPSQECGQCLGTCPGGEQCRVAGKGSVTPLQCLVPEPADETWWQRLWRQYRTWIIVGIVIAVIGLVVLIVLIVWFVRRRNALLAQDQATVYGVAGDQATVYGGA